MSFNNSQSPYTESRQEFCLALKATRERRGITLNEIANSTKIPAYMFAALERGDLKRWPKGLFRRAFFRDYVRMIGLPVAETTAEFVELFPDGSGSELTKAAVAATDADQPNGLRLAFDTAWHGPRMPVLSRLLVVPIDAGAVILIAAAVAWGAGLDRSTTTALVALAYFSVATVLVGESPAKWAVSRSRSVLDTLTQGTAAVASAWRRSADAVAPEPPQQLRVRVKLSQ